MRRARLPMVWTPVTRVVLGAMFDWEWRGYLKDRCSVDRDVAVRLGQDVRRG